MIFNVNVLVLMWLKSRFYLSIISSTKPLWPSRFPMFEWSSWKWTNPLCQWAFLQLKRSIFFLPSAAPNEQKQTKKLLILPLIRQTDCPTLIGWGRLCCFRRKTMAYWET